MTTSATDELMGAITELKSLFPDWRLGQLIANLILTAGQDSEGAIWDVEDDQLLRAAQKLIEQNATRREA